VKTVFILQLEILNPNDIIGSRKVSDNSQYIRLTPLTWGSLMTMLPASDYVIGIQDFQLVDEYDVCQGNK